MEAGVLHKRPNLKWGSDRGQNPPGSPASSSFSVGRSISMSATRCSVHSGRPVGAGLVNPVADYRPNPRYPNPEPPPTSN